MIKKRALIADLGLLITALVWGSGFVAVKNALDSLSPMNIMVFRFGIATILTTLFFYKKVVKVEKKDLLPGILIGLFLFLGFATQTIGLQYTTAGKQAFLTGTNVVMVPFIFWLISRQQPDKYSIIAAFLMLAGIGFLTLDHQFSIALNFGDVLTLICALFFACHITLVGYFAKKYDPIKITVIQFGTACLLSLLWMFTIEGGKLMVPSSGLNEVLFLGVFSTFVAFVIQNVAQKYTNPSHAALILSLESFFGSLLSILLLGEVFNSTMIVGSVIIFLAIITAETKWSFLKGGKESLTE